MLTLAINTASKMIFIGILRGEKLLASDAWESRADETEKLLAGITKILKKARAKCISSACARPGKARSSLGLRARAVRSQLLSFSGLNRIVVCCGPGSFSALRIGVTVASALAFALKIPLYELAPKYWEGRVQVAHAKRIKIGIPKYSLPPNITLPR